MGVWVGDDLIDSGGSTKNAAAMIKALGARKIYAQSSHYIGSANALERLELTTHPLIILKKTSHESNFGVSRNAG
jgi:phosphoribosylpyrophosphate synthetase